MYMLVYMGVNSSPLLSSRISARNLKLPPIYSVRFNKILTVFYQPVLNGVPQPPCQCRRVSEVNLTFCPLQFWNVYSIFPAEL